MVRTFAGALLTVATLAALAPAETPSSKNLPAQTSRARDRAGFTDAAFDHFYNLEYNEAVTDFRAAANVDPSSADAWIYLAQGIFYASMYDAGIMESDLVRGQSTLVKTHRIAMTPGREAEFLKALNTGEGLAQARLQRNASDSGAAFELGGVNALRASYALLAKHAWLTALRETNQSRRYFDQVMRMDPGNCDARLVPAINEYVVGTLPLLARMAARTVGMTANRKRGMEEIQRVAECGRRAGVNATILAAEIARRESDAPRAVVYLDKLIASYPRNFRFRIDLAMAYNEGGHHDKALAVMHGLNEMLARGDPGYSGARAARIRQECDGASRLIAGDREGSPLLAGAF